MNKKTVVRIVIDSPDPFTPLFDSFWLEQLRNAGYVQIHEDMGTHQTFDLLPPSNVDREAWARQTAERMQSFGINAVPAPPWKS